MPSKSHLKVLALLCADVNRGWRHPRDAFQSLADELNISRVTLTNKIAPMVRENLVFHNGKPGLRATHIWARPKGVVAYEQTLNGSRNNPKPTESSATALTDLPSAAPAEPDSAQRPSVGRTKQPNSNNLSDALQEVIDLLDEHDGELNPGKPIFEEMASILGISTAALKQRVKKLMDRGMIEHNGKRGIFATKIWRVTDQTTDGPSSPPTNAPSSPQTPRVEQPDTEEVDDFSADSDSDAEEDPDEPDDENNGPRGDPEDTETDAHDGEGEDGAKTKTGTTPPATRGERTRLFLQLLRDHDGVWTTPGKEALREAATVLNLDRIQLFATVAHLLRDSTVYQNGDARKKLRATAYWLPTANISGILPPPLPYVEVKPEKPKSSPPAKPSIGQISAMPQRRASPAHNDATHKGRVLWSLWVAGEGARVNELAAMVNGGNRQPQLSSSQVEAALNQLAVNGQAENYYPGCWRPLRDAPTAMDD